jgi:hypothetical protein
MFYREGAKVAKDVKTKVTFFLQELKDFLRVLSALAVPGF